MKPITVTQGDTPTLDFVLYGKNGAPAPLDGVVSSVTISFVSRSTGLALMTERAIVVVSGGAVGAVKWPVLAGDSATPDSFQGQFRAHYLDGTTQSFPDDGYQIFNVTKRIG